MFTANFCISLDALKIFNPTRSFIFSVPEGHAKSHIQTGAGNLVTDRRVNVFNTNNNNRNISNICSVCFGEFTKHIQVASRAFLSKFGMMYRNKKNGFYAEMYEQVQGMYGITINNLNATLI
jgi:hypothetical protein